jgi:hypothetical protein
VEQRHASLLTGCGLYDPVGACDAPGIRSIPWITVIYASGYGPIRNSWSAKITYLKNILLL